jgi:hypothetical protein
LVNGGGVEENAKEEEEGDDEEDGVLQRTGDGGLRRYCTTD